MDADRIELPMLLTGDAIPIHMDGVYFGESDGRCWRVIGYGRQFVWCEEMVAGSPGSRMRRIRPGWLRARPDTLEKIKADAHLSAEQYMVAYPHVTRADDVAMDLVRRCERVFRGSDLCA